MPLSKDQIAATIAAHSGFSLIDASGYKNLTSPIKVKCPNGHVFETSVEAARKTSFTCPECAKTAFQKVSRVIPAKTSDTYRIIAFDQATYKCGMSIWDNGYLVYYDLFTFNDYDLVARLAKIKQLLEKVVIPQWKPDALIFEDIQEQHGGVKTFKILAMLLGICETAAFENHINYAVLAPVVWRKEIGTVSGGRYVEKAWAVQKVKELLGLVVQEDTAEAILIGYSASRKMKKTLF